MVIHGLLDTCSLCFHNVCLLRDNPCISPQGCDEVVLKIVLKGVCVKSFVCLSKYLKVNLPTRKSLFVFLLDNAIPLLRNW